MHVEESSQLPRYGKQGEGTTASMGPRGGEGGDRQDSGPVYNETKKFQTSRSVTVLCFNPRPPFRAGATLLAM